MGIATDVDVRRIVANDWRALRALRLRALQDSPQAFLGSLAEETERPEPVWRRLADDRIWLAARLGDEPGGVASVVRHPDSQECYLESMWVDPRFRRRGVAAALLAGARTIARSEGRRRLFLWVLDGNTAAARTYEGYGFVVTGNRQRVPDHPLLVEVEYVIDIPSVDDARDDVPGARHGGVAERPHELEVDSLRRVPDDVH
jgi:ribosomal protein S18 acetylase RimI-like enzyme